MRRFIGAETEYGIATPSDPYLSPIISSTHAVVAYATARGMGENRARWDFSQESPLRDSRGFDLKRHQQLPQVDPNVLGIANVFLPNGARYYVDHAHPEYSCPEVDNAWDALVYDAAGDLVLLQAISDVNYYTERGISVLKSHDPCPPLKIYKNNVDGKGASYGAHENYRYRRDIEFDTIAQFLIPFFVCRQVIIGAGRVGLGQKGEQSGFQISQRADYIEQQISLETTLNRGIINTRDEPHTDPEKWGRLHVIIGDANMSHTANLLKFGMTSLVLDAIEAGTDFSDLRLQNPVREITEVSRDLSLKHQLQLTDVRRLNAVEVLRTYLDRITEAELDLSDIDKQVISLWDQVLDLLATDPLSTAHLLDWTAKYSLIQSFLKRGLSIDDAKIKLVDLQYADIDPTRSLYHALKRKGRMVTLASDAEIADAAANPPSATRAYFRGEIIKKFGEVINSANWDSISVNTDGDKRLLISMSELDDLNKEIAQPLIASAQTVDELVDSLAKLPSITIRSL